MHFNRGRAILSNITIDDTLPSINKESVIYNPPDAWNTKDTCPDGLCRVFLDEKRVQSGTLHESTAKHSSDRILTATTEFRGSAVYVYAVLPPSNPDLIPTAAVMFYIDGVFMTKFSAAPGSQYIYDFLVYSNSSLSLDSHNITIINGEVGGMESLFILDRIVYSTFNDDPSTTTSLNTIQPTTIPPLNPDSTSISGAPDRAPAGFSTGGIVGIIIGSLVGIIALSIIILYLRRRQNRHCIKDDTLDVSPWILGSSAAFAGPQKGWRIGNDSKSNDLSTSGRPPSYHSSNHVWS